MEKNIKEAIELITEVRKTMPECANKAFLQGALNELNEALAKIKAEAEGVVKPVFGPGYYCVSSAELVQPKPCEEWCGSECCKNICK